MYNVYIYINVYIYAWMFELNLIIYDFKLYSLSCFFH